MNRYLKDRLMKIREDSKRFRDSRNYDSRYDSGYDYRGDARSDYKGMDYRSDYEQSGDRHTGRVHSGTMQFYGHSTPYPVDSDYAMESDYKKDLEKWVDKLKSKDKFKLGFEQTIQQAKNHGVHFSKYTELEFYAIYLAMVSDYTFLGNEIATYIKMAKAFLEDDDMAVTPSEKVCIYMYYIVMGE